MIAPILLKLFGANKLLAHECKFLWYSQSSKRYSCNTWWNSI